MVFQLVDEDITTVPVRQLDRSRIGGRRPVVRGVGLVLAAQAGLVGWFVAHSWFFVDDFMFIRQGTDSSLTASYLRSPLFEHFSPLLRLVDWVLGHSVGPSWPVAVIVLTALTLACTSAFAYVMSAISSRASVVVVTTFLYAVSLFFVRNAVWWTGGVHLMSVTLFSLLTIGGYIRWHQHRAQRSLVVSVCSLALALLTHEDALILVGVLVLLRLLVLPPHPRSIREAMSSLLAEWSVWLVYGVLTTAGLWNFFTWYYFKSPRPTLSQFVRFMWMATAEGFFATLYLVKVPEAMIQSPHATGTLVLALSLAIIGTTIAMRRGAWRAWVFFGIGLAVAMVPLGLSRAAQFGVTIGREPRYQMEPAYLILVALAFVLEAPARHTAHHRIHPGLPAPGGYRLAAAGLMFIVYTSVYLRGAVAVSHMDPYAYIARTYFTNLTSSVDALRREGTDPALFDGHVPDSVMPAAFAPFNRYDRIVRLMVPSIRLDAPDASYVVGSDGRLEHVRIQERFSSVLSSAPSARIAGWAPQPGGSCFAPPAGGGQLRVAPPQRISGTRLVVRLDYRAFGVTDATLAVDGKTRPVHLGSDGTVYSYIGGPSVSTFSIDLAAPLACVTRLTVDELTPDGR